MKPPKQEGTAFNEEDLLFGMRVTLCIGNIAWIVVLIAYTKLKRKNPEHLAIEEASIHIE